MAVQAACLTPRVFSLKAWVCSGGTQLRAFYFPARRRNICSELLLPEFDLFPKQEQKRSTWWAHCSVFLTLPSW